MKNKNLIRNSLRGLVIGDVAGVPYEFKKDDEIKELGFSFMSDSMLNRSHNQPIGTWSDDTGLALATMDGLISCNDKNIPLNNVQVSLNFLSWFVVGEYMPYWNTFDIGNTTATSLRDLFINAKRNGFWQTHTNEFYEFIYSKDRWRKMSGDSNGALMRILPYALWFSSFRKTAVEDVYLKLIKDSVYLTHPSMLCFLSSLLFIEIVIGLLETGYVDEGLKIGRERFLGVYSKHEDEFQNEWIEQIGNRRMGSWVPNLRLELKPVLSSDFKLEIKDVEFRETFGSVGALRAALISLVHGENFKQVIQNAVEFGGDTDTVAAIAGALAGAVYPIPEDWYSAIPKISLVDDFIDSFCQLILSNSEVRD